MDLENLPAGHVINISESTYRRLCSETEHREETPDIGGQSSGVIGTHPNYGLISLSCVDSPARHPNYPSYTLIIMGQDERISGIRADLEIDD